MIIKNSRLIYSDFVSNRPEPTSLFELWCMLGGVINLFIVIGLSDEIISNAPNSSILISLFLPAILFCLDYLSKEVAFFSVILRVAILCVLVYCVYAMFVPANFISSDFGAIISIFLFGFVGLILVLTKKLRN